MKNKYNLIWFQHFHKAAGTTIVELAQKNKEVFWPVHENGNPVVTYNNFIKLWKYSEDGLNAFVDLCEEKGVTFVATEWGLPILDVLAKNPRVTLITCLRNPIDRFVSNFYYDLYNEFTMAKKINEYINSSKSAFTMFNYYTRVLSKHDNNPQNINEDFFYKAKDRLDQFDCCLILEDGFSELKNVLKWDITPVHSNRSTLTMKEIIANRKWKSLYYQWRYPKQKISTDFVDYFTRKNFWDMQLYNDKRKKTL